MTIVMVMCFGVFVQAEPLPLVPGTTATTPETRETVSATTVKPTEETAVSEETETTAKTTTETTAKTIAQENIIEDTENQAAAAASEGNTDIINTVESRNKLWFETEQKAQSDIDRIASALAGDGDYRSKAHLAARLLKSRQEIVPVGQAGADDMRAAIDAALGWDYTYGIY